MPAPNAGDPLRTMDPEAARSPAPPPTEGPVTLPPAPPTLAVDAYPTLPPASVQGSKRLAGRVPGYEILAKLGKGVVYKARQVQSYDRC